MNPNPDEDETLPSPDDDETLFVTEEEVKDVISKRNKSLARFYLEKIRLTNWDSEASPCYNTLNAMELVQLAQIADYPKSDAVTCVDAINFVQINIPNGDIDENWRVDCAIHICNCDNCRQNVVSSGLLQSQHSQTIDEREKIQAEGEKKLRDLLDLDKKKN